MFRNLCNDTLKKNGKWSKTNLTMFTSYIISISMAIYDMFYNGFNFQVFIVYICLSTGMKYFDYKSDQSNRSDSKIPDKIDKSDG